MIDVGSEFIIDGDKYIVTDKGRYYDVGMVDGRVRFKPDVLVNRYKLYCSESDETLSMNETSKEFISLIRDKRIGDILC